MFTTDIIVVMTKKMKNNFIFNQFSGFPVSDESNLFQIVFDFELKFPRQL